MGKWLGVLLFSLLLLSFVTDRYVISYTYESAGRGIEHSIDAGIVKAGIITDAQAGFVQLDEDSLRNTIRSEFIRNMKLNSTMESKYMKQSALEIEINYDANDVPWIQARFKTQVSFSFPWASYPITVNRKIAYESIYK